MKVLIFFLSLFFLLSGRNLCAQHKSSSDTETFLQLKTILNDAVKTAHRDSIRMAIKGLKEYTGSNSLGYLAHYYLSYAWYRLYNFSVDESEETQPEYLDFSITHAGYSIERKPDFSEALILLGNCYGIKAEKGFFAGIRYGSKAKGLFRQALEIDPSNPRAAMYIGVATLFQPALFGGTTEKAIRQLHDAEKLFQQSENEDPLLPDWGYSELYAWLGQAYDKNGEYDKAIEAYRSALKINPGYRWVRDKLLPDLKEKMSN